MDGREGTQRVGTGREKGKGRQAGNCYKLHHKFTIDVAGEISQLITIHN